MTLGLSKHRMAKLDGRFEENVSLNCCCATALNIDVIKPVVSDVSFKLIKILTRIISENANMHEAK